MPVAVFVIAVVTSFAITSSLTISFVVTSFLTVTSFVVTSYLPPILPVVLTMVLPSKAILVVFVALMGIEPVPSVAQRSEVGVVLLLAVEVSAEAVALPTALVLLATAGLRLSHVVLKATLLRDVLLVLFVVSLLLFGLES